MPSHKGTALSIAATIATNPDGTFQYSYSVSNGPYARQAIAEWSVETGPSRATKLAHTSWSGRLVASPAPEPPQAIIFRNRAQFSSANSDIEPGSSATGFEVTSDLAPGFVTARAKARAAGSEPTAQQLSGLPPATVLQLATCLSEGWDTTAVLVLGPAVAKEVSARETELNFSNVIARLNRVRRGHQPSAALEKVNALLMSALASDSHGVKSGDLDSARASAQASEVPIIDALRLSLDHIGALVP